MLNIKNTLNSINKTNKNEIEKLNKMLKLKNKNQHYILIVHSCPKLCLHA